MQVVLKRKRAMFRNMMIRPIMLRPRKRKGTLGEG